MPPTPGYNEASRRAAEAAKLEADKRAAEDAAKREILERHRTPGYVSSLDQDPDAALNRNSWTARERAEITGASDKVQRKADAKEFTKQEFERARSEAGENTAVSQMVRVDIDTGEMSGITTARSIRAGVPQVNYSTRYEDEYQNIPFQSRIINDRNIPLRIGDIMRKESVKASEGRPSLYGPRTTFDASEVDRFVSEYSNFQKGNATRENSTGPADFPILTPVKGRAFQAEGFGTYGEKITIQATPPILKEIHIRHRPPKDEVGAGYSAPFENLFETFKFTLTENLPFDRKVPRTTFESETGYIVKQSGIPQYKPDLEGSLVEAGLTSGISTFQGKPTLEPFQKTFSDVSLAPLYFAGAGLGALTLFAVPTKPGAFLGAGKALTAITYAKGLLPVARRAEPFTQLVSKGFARAYSPIDRFAYAEAGGTSFSAIGKKFTTEIIETGQAFARPVKSLLKDVELATLEPRVRVTDAIYSGAYKVKEGLEPIAMSLERLPYTRASLPRKPRFGYIFDPVAENVRVSADFVNIPIRAGRDVTSKGLDVLTDFGRQTRASLEPMSYLRFRGQSDIPTAFSLFGSSIAKPFGRLPYTTFRGADELRLGLGIAGDTFKDISIGPYIKAARKFRTIKNESIATFDADLISLTRPGKAARNVEKLLGESLLGLERTGKGKVRFDVGLEDSDSTFQAGLVDIPKKELSLITRGPLSGEETGKLEGVAKRVEGIFEKETTGRKDVTPFGEIRDGTLRGLFPTMKESKLPIFKDVPFAPEIDDSLKTFYKVPRAAKEPQKVADIVTYDTDILKGFAKALKSPKDVKLLRGNEIEKALGLPLKRTKKFEFGEVGIGPLGKTSAGALDVQKAFDFDRLLGGTGKAADDFIIKSASSGKGVKETESSTFGLFSTGEGLGLGLGGGVFPRRKRKVDSFGTDFDILASQTGSKDVDSLLGQFPRLSKLGKSNVGLNIDSIEKNLLGNLEKSMTKSLSRGKTSDLLRTNNIFDTRIVPNVSSREAEKTGLGLFSAQLAGTATALRTEQALVFPQVPVLFPPRRPFDIDFKNKKGKRKKKGRGLRATRRTFKTTDPLAAVLGGRAGARVQSFSDMFS